MSPFFADAEWQMAYGERAALEGLLSALKPVLAVEIGTARGGSLRRIAAHAEEVHAFDIAESVRELAPEIPNATFHVGDSGQLLPQALAEFVRAGRHVDFALIDGEHSAAGVERDARALLESEACRQTLIVFHDSANEEVRAGLEALDLSRHPKVALVVLDFVPGYLTVPDHPLYPHAIWNGLALVALDDSRHGPPFVQGHYYGVTEVYRIARAHFEAQATPSTRP